MTTIASTRRLAFGTEEVTFVIRSLKHSIRNYDALTMAIVLPVMLMLMFTFIFGGALETGVDYVTYVVPGAILLCAGFGASSAAVDVATDMQSGIIDRFRTMQIRSWAVLTGHTVASLVRNLVATAIVVGVGIAIGFRPTADPIEWVAATALIAFYILAITYLFAAIGLSAGSAEAANGYGFILLFVPYISSAFVPIDTLPTWLRWIAENQPLTPIIETIRGLLTGTGYTTEPLQAVGWCALILAIAMVWGAIMFRRKAGRR